MATKKSNAHLNARRDAFTGQVIILAAEDRPFFEQFQSRLLLDLRPETALERSLAYAIVWDTWRLNHLRAIEMNLFALGAEDPAATARDSRIQPAVADAATFDKDSECFLRLSLCEQRLSRSLHKNLATFRALQYERRRQEADDRAEEVLLARYSDIRDLPYRAPAVPSPNGFVFSNEEILEAAHRASALEVARTTLSGAPRRVQFAASAASSSTGKIVNWPEPDTAA
ncbi:MAG TPA: hypothetical protein VHC90_22760 [Bryobacteraceae bacterium]|nr:hypothetical protein [Bryobacteraceae bacterium]